MRRACLAGVLLAVSVLVGCGDDDVNAPSNPPPLNLAGTYSGFSLWLIQVVRVNDNFTTSFNCQGTLTISQTAGTGGVGMLSGFAVVGAPCPPLSFPLSGTIRGDGSLTLVTGGPRPPEGPCPPAPDVQYVGVATATSLSARAVATVQCPQFGEHHFAYIISGRRTSS
jgi:hypothetical protein